MQLHFGKFVIDSDSRQLRRRGVERHVTPKAFELLWLLIQNRPRALSKNEIHARLWPSTFVSDATLTSLVAELRAALGERARRQLFLRTVYKYGYAFRGRASEFVRRSQAVANLPRAWIIWDWGQVALKEGDHLLGRDTDVSVWLESPTVSRHHARIRVTATNVIVEDLESKNGTFVCGRRLRQPSPLADGDEIRLGSVLVRFRKVEPGASTDTQSH